jgi:hypothetical protein
MCWKDRERTLQRRRRLQAHRRDEHGVIVTLIADNYFGYCKKEVKTQISYAANLLGQAEEEHAGGALVFASFDLGEEFDASRHVRPTGHTYDEDDPRFATIMDPKPRRLCASTEIPRHLLRARGRPLRPAKTTRRLDPRRRPRSHQAAPRPDLRAPSGYKVHMEKPPDNRLWRLVGTRADAALCHKPCTVSGGGKSEISKSISDAILTGRSSSRIRVRLRLGRRSSSTAITRSASSTRPKRDQRPILSPDRSLGSVIKLLTPSPRITPPNTTPGSAPFPSTSRNSSSSSNASTDPNGATNGASISASTPSTAPRQRTEVPRPQIVTTHLRVGYHADGAWRTFGLRKDFMPAIKIQARTTSPPPSSCPRPASSTCRRGNATSVKFVQNCEFRLFQRPDDAIHRGYDKQTEARFLAPGQFLLQLRTAESRATRAR